MSSGHNPEIFNKHLFNGVRLAKTLYNQQFGSQCFEGLKIHEKLSEVNDVIIRIVLYFFRESC